MSNKIDYTKPLEFMSLDPVVIHEIDQNGRNVQSMRLLTGRVSIMWEDIISIEEFLRRHLVNNDQRDLSIIRTRFTPNGYIAVANYEEVYSAWEVYLNNNRLGLGNTFRFN
jgi:hypothetical protein